MNRGGVNSTRRAEVEDLKRNDEVRMANDEWKSVFSSDIRNSNFVIRLGDRLKAGLQREFDL
jgi:hypothetical protein